MRRVVIPTFLINHHWINQMKKIIFTLACLIFISCASTKLPPIGPTKEMIKNADEILLTVNEPPNKAYQDFAKYLSNNGFGLASTDKSLMFIKTDNKQIAKSNFSYHINATIDSSKVTVIHILGIGSNLLGGNFNVENRGSYKSALKVAWNEMDRLAESYPHTKIMYKRN